MDGLARGWKDGRSLRALGQAAERLALASPVAVAKLIERLQSMDENIILRAATAILDRAGMETAAKSSSETAGTLAVSSDQLAAAMRQAQDEADEMEDAVVAGGWQAGGWQAEGDPG